MSNGQTCHHCFRGKMRLIHFSWDQAVILCDNKRCTSLLDISPSECIIKKDILHSTHQHFSSELDLQCLLNDGSSRSSSGVYSEARSSLPSPAQSGKSITDEEVELLLNASYAPLSYKDTTVISAVSSGAVTHTHASPKLQNSESDSSRYDEFFELLRNLDLEPQSQPVNPEPQTVSNSAETSFDVTAELEGRMKDFDFNSSCFDSNPSNDPSAGDQRPPDETLRVATSLVTNIQEPSIPSQRSAFIPVDASKEYATSLDAEQNSSVNSFVCHNSLVVNNETPNYVQQCENPCFSSLLASEFVNDNIPNFHTRFMSPTVSAASEDSGYNEEDGKVIIGTEPLVNEESSKASSKTALLSSVKKQNSCSMNKLITQTNEDNLKDLIQNNLEWPVMSGMHTLTVLPAIVTTEKNNVNTPSQATGSNETSSAVQDMREQVDSRAEEQIEMPQVRSGLCQDNEHEIMSLGNYENILTNDICTTVQNEREQIDLSTGETMSIEHHENILHEIHAGSPAESSRTSVTSPVPESTVSDGSSLSTSSEVKAVSEKVNTSEFCSSASSTIPENESKNKRGKHETSRNLRVRKDGGSSTRKHVLCDDNDTFLNSKIPKVRGKRKRRGVEEIKERAKRKGKSSQLRSERKKPGSLNKACVGKLTKRPENVGKVQLMEHLLTSSGENYFLENAADGLLEVGDSIDLPGCQTLDGGTNHLSPRGRNLSPRKLLMSHVNKDPWSVVDLSLEELTIEIVVERGQREASSHSEKATKCDVQLQQLMSLFSKESESEASHVSTNDTIQNVPPEVIDGALLEKENEGYLSTRENSGFKDRKETAVHGDDNRNLAKNSGQDLHTLENLCSRKGFSEENESGESNVSNRDAVQDISSKVSEGRLLENEKGECLFEGKNFCYHDSERKTTHGDVNQNLTESSGHALENFVSLQRVVKDSDSEVSHVPVEDTVQEVPSKESGGALLKKKNMECHFKGENSGIDEIMGKATSGDGSQVLMGSSEQNLQNLEKQASTKRSDLTNPDKIKLKDPSLDTFHRLPSELDSSQFNVCNDSKCPKNIIQRNAELVQISDADNAFQPNINAIENKEHELAADIGYISLFSEEPKSVENEELLSNVEIASRHSLSKEISFVKQIVPSVFEEGVLTLSEDEKNCSGVVERVHNMKHCFNKLVEPNDHSLGIEHCKLNKEKFISEETESPSFCQSNVSVFKKATYEAPENCELKFEKFVSEGNRHPSFNVDILSASEKTALKTLKRQCSSGSGSGLKVLRIVECENPWFDKEYDKNISESETIVTEKLVLDKLTTSLDQNFYFEIDSNSLSTNTSREASLLHFLNPPKHETARNWIGHEDSVSKERNKSSIEEKVVKSSDSSKPCSDFKSQQTSSMYFESLVKDMDFDEHFFQCPVQEHQSETLSEHLKSSLFFGETASDEYSPSHVELSEEVLPDFKSSSRSNNLDMALPQAYNNFAGSEPSAAYIQVPVPLPSSIAQPPSTSISTSISQHTVSSILGEKVLGGKALMIPKNSQVKYMMATSHGMNTNLAGSVLLSPTLKLPLPNLLPEHSDIGSGGRGVGCRKPGSVSELGKLISNWETEAYPEPTEEKATCADEVAGNSLEKPVEMKLRYSHCLSGLSSEGLGRKQGNCSSSEFVEPEAKYENSVALSHSSIMDTQDKTSNFSESLETECESKLSPTNFTNVLSNGINFKQTSLCYCSVCDCNTGNFKHKNDLTKHCREQTSNKTDIFCSSDADADKLPTISFNSDNEIHITIEGNSTDQPFCETGKEYVTSNEDSVTKEYSVKDHINLCCYSNESMETKVGENLMNDIYVHQCYNNESVDAKLSEMKHHRESHSLLVGSGSKRKADDQHETCKKQRLLDTPTDIQTELYKHTPENQPRPICNAPCGALMCGILDSSVLHDENCFSSSHENFQDFPTLGVSKERQPEAVKTYRGSSKHCNATECNENVSNILRSSVVKESMDENDYSVCNNNKGIDNTTFQDTAVFSHNFEFGSLKAGPQYDGYSYLRIEHDINDLNFLQVDSSYTEFLAPLISPSESPASTPEPEQEESDSKYHVLQESGKCKENRKNENMDRETVKHRYSMLHEEIKQNTSGPALVASNDGLKARNVFIAPHTLSQTSSTNDISGIVNQLPVSCKDGELFDGSVSNDSIRFTGPGQNDNYNATERTSTDGSGSKKIKRIIVFRKPSPSSLSVPQAPHASKKISSTTNLLVPNSSFSVSASPTVSTCGLSDAPTKTIICESYPRSQCVAGVTAPHSGTMLSSTLSSPSMTPHPWTLASPSCTSSNIAIIKVASSGIKKQKYQIDCQKPAFPNTYTIVPPVLASSDATVIPSLAYQPLISACMRGSSLRHPPEGVASPPVSLRCLNYDRKLTAQNERNSYTQEEGANMLKKVRMGPKGSFYFRPTPALKNAILEMRKKVSEERKIEEKDSTSGYVTLPDGTPISHPIFIPKRNEVQVVRQKRKTVKKKRDKRVRELVEEKVRESIESCNEEIPKMIVIYARKSFHICQIEVTENR